ncbi:ABC transporter ATP-binding protein [Candidatus Poribacteria bacterium]|nr:ABC transporter ATP-binding protein [Candidatus Poribacteria bacterium]
MDVIYTILLVFCGFAIIVIGLSLQHVGPFLVFLAFVTAGAIFLSRLGWLRNFRQITNRNPRSLYFALALCIVAYPFIFTLLKSAYWIHVAAIAGIYACLALGLNITVGFAGLLDLGYVAFYAIGAYSSAIFFRHYPDARWMFWVILPAAALLAGIFGLLLGSPTLRLRGDYLAIVTLGFGQIVRIIATNWESVTNGPKGIADIPGPTIGRYSFETGIPVGSLVLPRVANYYFLIVLLALGIGVAANRLNHSRIGRAWIAIREDELAASCSGVNVTAIKLLAFAIGASFAGIAGVVYSSLIGFVDPMSFTFMESAMIVCMVVLGGMGSIPGVIVGAIVLAILPEKLREFEQIRMLLFGAALIAMMAFRPEGLIPSKRREQELLETTDE